MPYAGMRDVDTTLRTGATDLNATETTPTVRVQGTPLAGLALVIDVPSVSGTSPTLSPKLQHGNAADGSDATDLVLVLPAITAVGQYIRRFYTDKRFVRAVLTLGGTSPNFGRTKVWLTVHDVNR